MSEDEVDVRCCLWLPPKDCAYVPGRQCEGMRDLSGPCPDPVVAGWTMEDCWRARKCSCAIGVEMGYRPTTMPHD